MWAGKWQRQRHGRSQSDPSRGPPTMFLNELHAGKTKARQMGGISPLTVVQATPTMMSCGSKAKESSDENCASLVSGFFSTRPWVHPRVCRECPQLPIEGLDAAYLGFDCGGDIRFFFPQSRHDLMLLETSFSWQATPTSTHGQGRRGPGYILRVRHRLAKKLEVSMHSVTRSSTMVSVTRLKKMTSEAHT